LHKRNDWAKSDGDMMILLREHRDEMTANFDRVQKRMDLNKGEGDLGNLSKSFQAHKDEMSGHFERVQRKFDQNKADVDKALMLDVTRALDKAFADHRTEMGNQFDRVNKKVDQGPVYKDQARDVEGVYKALQAHREEMTSQFDRVHREFDRVHRDDSDSLEKSRSGHRWDDVDSVPIIRALDQAFNNHQIEMGNQFDRVQKKIEQNKVDGDIVSFGNLLQAHKEEMNGHFDRVNRKFDNKGDTDMAPVFKALDTAFHGFNAQMGQHFDRVHKTVDLETVYKVLSTHKEEMSGQFERVHRKIDQTKGGDIDVAPILRTLEEHKGELGNHQAKLQHVLEEHASQLDGLQRLVKDNKIAVDVAGILRAIKDNKVEVDLRPIHSSLQDHRSEMQQTLAQVNKGITSRIDLSGQLAPVLQAIRDNRREVDPLHRSLEDQLQTVSKSLQENKSSMESLHSQLLRAIRENTSEVDLGPLQRLLLESRADTDVSPLLRSLSEHREEMESRLSTIQRSVRECRPEVDLPPKWLQDHSSAMMDNFSAVQKSVREIVVDMDLASLQRTIMDGSDLSPILKAILDHKTDVETNLGNIQRVLRESRDIDLGQQIQKWMHEQKADTEQQFSTLNRAVRESSKETDFSAILRALDKMARDAGEADLKPLTKAVKDGKTETDIMLMKMEKVHAEVHSAVNRNIPARLTECSGQLEMLSTQVKTIQDNLRSSGRHDSPLRGY